MSDWIKIGSRYINLANVTEARLHDRPQFARLYFTNGATVDLDEDDTDILLMILGERTEMTSEAHRTIIAAPPSE